MKKFLGGRGLSAVAGLFLIAASNAATAAPVQASVVPAVAADTAARPVVSAPQAMRAVATVNRATTAAVATVTGSVTTSIPAASVSATLAPAIAREAAWLQQAGWPLHALVDRYSVGAPLTEEANCIAVAVYHEARGETLEGQLAVARVIMNRAASGRYPSSWCGVVKQPWQFSFVNPRTGYMPGVDESSAAWRRALGVTRLAINNAVQSVPADCLWYHANYVSPSWGRRLTRVSQIGAHIFYRA